MMYVSDKVNLKGKGQRFVADYMRRNNWTLNYFDENTMTAEYSKTGAGVTIRQTFITFTKNWRVKEVR